MACPYSGRQGRFSGDPQARGISHWLENIQGKIPRGVYPERQGEILRSAQNDKRRAQDDSEGLRMTAKGSE
jgi:hypothetical protein